MRSGVMAGVIVVCMILASPVMAHAQEEAVVSGRVTDSSGGVLPGVVVRAVHERTGNAFEAVTDGLGAFRMAVRVGPYRVTADLAGFTATPRMVELLLGQTAIVNLQMSPAGVAETVTVTSEAPLIETTTSTLGANVDPRQVAELPTYGRNWQALAMLAPGSRTQPVARSRSAADQVVQERNDGDIREFQVNVDGQQVTSDFHQAQPRYSIDSIAEFQYISNRFDATQGRSDGVQVNIITKSGTNRLAGLLRANFRNSHFNAPNRVLGRVEPIDNQQISTALGGPVVRDKLHFFGNYEYEREPRTSIWRTPYPNFNVSLEGTNNQKKGGVRVDYQLSPRTRLMGKVSGGRYFEPFGLPSSNGSPAATQLTEESSDEAIGQLTQVLSNRALNEIRGGRARVEFYGERLTTWANHWYKDRSVTTGSPSITFTGFSSAGGGMLPRRTWQHVWSVRDDFTYSFSAKGRHDLRTGGELLYRSSTAAQCRNCSGSIDARGGPLPSAAQLAAWFPDPFNADTWNFAALSPITRSYIIGVGNFTFSQGSKKIGSWVQDDWQIASRLTLNLGLRYDVGIGIWGNDISFPPFQEAGRPNDWKNVQPRFGFAYRVNDRTVIRGGSGLYYGDTISADQASAVANTQISQIRYDNDGRPDFTANPTNGRPLPTYDQAIQLFCDKNNNAPGCLTRDVQDFVALPQYIALPRTWQTSIGFQRQLRDTMAIEADYVYSKGDHEKDTVDNVNLLYDRVTGANLDFRIRSNRPYPNWGVVSMNTHTASSTYHGLITGWTKRFDDGWQASASYTLSGFWATSSRPFSGLYMVPFHTVPDLGGESGFVEVDQRHRAVFSGIWELGRGFQVSGMHYLGAGIRQPHNYGGDLRNTGATFSGRLRPDGTITPLNDIIAPPQNRTDLRLQQRIPLRGRLSIDGIAEVFNMFNRPNWTIGTQESTRVQFLQHTNAQYRTAQVGFRLTF